MTDSPNCKRCNVKMTVGIGINPTRSDEMKNALSGPEVYITAETITLDRVWKCSTCGHSEDL